jgi:hypothetical protein
VLLVATVVVAGLVLARSVRPRRPPTRWRTIGRAVLLVLSVAWIGVIAWLAPVSAQQPALAAMASDAHVTVSEYPTQIVLAPVGTPSATAVFFQPGAKVEARAYAAILRPVAEAGHVVVIVKQPLNIGFLALGVFGRVQAAYPSVTRWVVGGHSLGGTVACIDADGHDTDPQAPVVGLLLYASYPATDMSSSLTTSVLSISATHDGLATPAKIDASRRDLPASSVFVAIDGSVHAFFGDYGPQPGDGTPTITHDDARAQVSAESVDFVSSFGR